jgi:ribonuclease HI
MKNNNVVDLYFDGYARGNHQKGAPREAGFSYAALHGGEVRHRTSAMVGDQTNNEAELLALANALQYARELQGRTRQELVFRVKGDSQLAIEAMAGSRRIKAKNLQPYLQACLANAKNLTVVYERVEREEVVAMLGH